jgi:hypothetical protein
LKTYLGDGVYADWDGHPFVITTENGIAVTNRIVLELETYEALEKWVHQLAARVAGSRK